MRMCMCICICIRIFSIFGQNSGRKRIPCDETINLDAFSASDAKSEPNCVFLIVSKLKIACFECPLTDSICYLVCFRTSLSSPSHSSRRAIQVGPILGSGRHFGGSKHAIFILPTIQLFGEAFGDLRGVLARKRDALSDSPISAHGWIEPLAFPSWSLFLKQVICGC